jgi:hypothetical protein
LDKSVSVLIHVNHAEHAQKGFLFKFIFPLFIRKLY